MVLVPTLNRWVTDSIAGFFAKAVHKNYDENHKFKYTVSTLSELDGYALVRNVGARDFLASPCDRLWFIDNDTILPEDIFSLPEVDGDIVTLPYPFASTMTPAIVNYTDVDDFSKGFSDVEPGDDGVADVNGSGMGCTLIRRYVLEDPGMHYSSVYTNCESRVTDERDELDAPPAIFKFRRKPSGRWEMGEDYDFCIRAKRLGYSIKLRMTSVCGHLKTIDLNDAYNRSLASTQGQREDTRTYSLAG